MFDFDKSYWSHDGFYMDANGVNVAEDERYASQQTLYEDFGRAMLESALEGKDSCLLSYGPTGSGRSYSCMGHDADEGIVPRILRELFRRRAELDELGGWSSVAVSMLEIKADKLHDLLVYAPQSEPTTINHDTHGHSCPPVSGHPFTSSWAADALHGSMSHGQAKRQSETQHQSFVGAEGLRAQSQSA